LTVALAGTQWATVTAERHKAYEEVLRALQESRGWALDETACEVLRDLAEGLLLAGDEVAACELRRSAAATLCVLADDLAITEGAGRWLWRRLQRCGPPLAASHRSFRAVQEREFTSALAA
jgi:hypothetical protein